VKLEDEAALHQPQVGPLIFGKRRGFVAADNDFALGRRIEQAEQIKQ
jgi:hypothetical protein